MGHEFSRRAQRVFRVGPAFVLTAMLALPQAADARPSREPSPPVVVPPLEAALAGEPLDPRWPKRVFVITDSVMLGAKTAFPKSLPGWEVVFAGRPALMVDKATAEVRTHSNTGPIAVVALGYNTLWEKDRKDFQRWARRFENHAEEMIATLKARGAKKIIWVTLREISSDNIPSGRVSVMQLNKYAYFFPYVNERLRELKKRHPELAIADWSRAAKRVGYTYDAIHINTRGAELLSETVKVAMGVDTNAVATQTAEAPAPAPAPAPTPARAPEPQHIIELPRAAAPQPQRTVDVAPRTITPRQVRIDTIQVRATETPPNAQPQIMVEEAETPRVVARSEEPPKRLNYRERRQAMFALSRIDSASVVMLGDSLTERAQWSEILGCHFVANRGIGADDSAGVLRRLDDVTRLRPAAVFLMIGVNDVSSSVPAAKIVSNVRQTIEQLSVAGAQVYLTLVLPVTQGYARQINGRIDELNAAYRALAQETGARIVDFRAQTRTGDGHLRDEMSLDGIHLSTAGYRVWRDAIVPLVAQHCPAVNDMRVATRANPPIAAPQPRVVAAAVVPSQTALPAVMAPPPPVPVARAYAAEPAPTTTASVAPRGSWTIQIGAYPEEDKAKEKLREAQSLGASVLANARPFTEKTVKGSVELYRARFAGFSQSAAEAACSYFKRNAIDCITVRN